MIVNGTWGGDVRGLNGYNDLFTDSAIRAWEYGPTYFRTWDQWKTLLLIFGLGALGTQLVRRALR